ncbi:hypothetical protein B0H13DRAFT_2118473 [Mycena leptocephala]|nr:hypothetical protein B0H13DRAFT_2118473 [Mycena leptocephala]
MIRVEELRARIEKLSTEIILQRELLKKLEHDKSLVQRQLNSVLDPVARLPLEISSEIFLRRARHVPMLLLNICNAWTDIALSTPSLWAAIRIVFPSPDGFKELLPAWLHRAGNRLLSVSFRGTVDGDIAAIIWRHGQLKHLEICCGEGDEEDDNEDANVIDLFGGMSPGPLPFLETLTIRDLDDIDREYSGLQILKLLRLAPNLVECILDSIHPVYDIGVARATTEKLVLPALRRLIFGGSNVASRLRESLHLLPTLTLFYVWRPGSDFTAELFIALADSSLLPNLHTLTIDLYHSDIFDSSCMTFLRALSARRTKLQSVRVTLAVGAPLSLEPADVLAAFRELVADGMQVHIGTEKDNFITD